MLGNEISTPVNRGATCRARGARADGRSPGWGAGQQLAQKSAPEDISPVLSIMPQLGFAQVLHLLSRYCLVSAEIPPPTLWVTASVVAVVAMVLPTLGWPSLTR